MKTKVTLDVKAKKVFVGRPEKDLMDEVASMVAQVQAERNR